MSDRDDIKRSLSSDTIKALVLGDQVFMAPVMAGNMPFVFTPAQAQFLISLQKLKNVHAAATHVGMDEIWANQFLHSKKFVTFRNLKLEESRAKNGMTVEYLMQYAEWTLEGRKRYYKVTCPCGLEEEWSLAQGEASRNDAMEFEANCAVCYQPVHLTLTEEKFEPSREQNEMWKELASRLYPKVERVSHTFTSEEYIFEGSSMEGN